MAIVVRNGKTREVKNLGWLMHHRHDVTDLVFVLSGARDGSGTFIATLTDGLYITEYASVSVWQSFVKRPSWAHLTPRINRLNER